MFYFSLPRYDIIHCLYYVLVRCMIYIGKCSCMEILWRPPLITNLEYRDGFIFAAVGCAIQLYRNQWSYLQQDGYTSHVNSRLVKGTSTVVSDLHANHKNYDQLAKTVLVALNKGDTFWVKLEKSGGYAVHGNSRYTEFGGFLIQQIINEY